MIGAAGFEQHPKIEADAATNKEGWTWLRNSRKWHYFRAGKSLCKRYMLLKHPSEGYESGNNGSTDNCASCKREILKEQGAAA